MEKYAGAIQGGTGMKCKDCKHDFNDRWIPVSERLPEEDTYCYVTVQAPGGQPHSHPGYYRTKHGFSWGYVTAWMPKPLPTPYKEECP